MTFDSSQILPWLDAHPVTFTLVLWPLLTGAINLAWKDASAYADTHPRLAPVKKILQKLGLSPKGVIDLIARAATARGLPPPPVVTVEIVSAPPPALDSDPTSPGTKE